jgi:hypothetical protein
MFNIASDVWIHVENVNPRKRRRKKGRRKKKKTEVNVYWVEVTFSTFYRSEILDLDEN